MSTSQSYKSGITLFGQRLKKIREEKGWSQELLAKKSGMTVKTISNYERGKIIPREKNLIELGKAFKIEASQLCPSLHLVNSKNILFDRFKGETECLNDFIEKANKNDLEALEHLLKTYELVTDFKVKLGLDFTLHQMLTSYSQTKKQETINQLIVEFYSHVREFMSDPKIFKEKHKETLYNIHYLLAKAALDKNKERILCQYDRHLDLSLYVVNKIYGINNEN